MAGQGWLHSAALTIAVLCAGSVALAQGAAKPAAGFNVNQAIGGKAAYDEHCAACHGADLAGSGPAVALRGPAFLGKWAVRSPARLFSDIRRMPPGQADSLPPTTYANIFAYLLQANGVSAGSQYLPAAEEALSQLSMPAPGAARSGPPPRPPLDGRMGFDVWVGHSDPPSSTLFAARLALA